MKQYKIVVLGTGIIGAGLAVNAILKDQIVTIYDVIDQAKMQSNIENVMNRMIDAGVVDAQTAAEKMKSVSYTNDISEALKGGADLVQEAVPEKLELKQSIYKQIQEIAGDQVLIASTTSAMFPSKLSEGALYPEKIVVGHPYNPSYMLPLIEVCGGETASAESVEKAVEIYKAMGKEPIVCKKEHKGFIVNNMSWAVLFGAIEVVKAGLCSAEDVDKALMYGPGMRMAVLGQLLTISQGIEGGFANASAKYGIPNDPVYAQIGEEIFAGMEKRPEEQGRTVEEVNRFADKAYAQILKIHGLL